MLNFKSYKFYYKFFTYSKARISNNFHKPYIRQKKWQVGGKLVNVKVVFICLKHKLMGKIIGFL